MECGSLGTFALSHLPLFFPKIPTRSSLRHPNQEFEKKRQSTGLRVRNPSLLFDSALLRRNLKVFHEDWRRGVATEILLLS